VSGSGISWAICKSAPRSKQITTPAPHHSVFTGRMLFLPPNQQRQSTEGQIHHDNNSNIYRVGQKRGHKIIAIILSILTDLQFFSLKRFHGKFAVN